MFIIWDVHWHHSLYHKLIQWHDETIQVWDFGFKQSHEYHRENINAEHHKMLFGNHDDTEYKYYPHSLGDYGYYQMPSGFTFFFVRWALSIDKEYRLTYESMNDRKIWREDEELTMEEWEKALEEYKEVKPKIMLTHDCPKSVQPIYLSHHHESSRTNMLLEAMFHYHKPDIWIHWHHHISEDNEVEGTRFICLSELEWVEISKEGIIWERVHVRELVNL